MLTGPENIRQQIYLRFQWDRRRSSQNQPDNEYPRQTLNSPAQDYFTTFFHKTSSPPAISNVGASKTNAK